MDPYPEGGDCLEVRATGRLFRAWSTTRSCCSCSSGGSKGRASSDLQLCKRSLSECLLGGRDQVCDIGRVDEVYSIPHKLFLSCGSCLDQRNVRFKHADFSFNILVLEMKLHLFKSLLSTQHMPGSALCPRMREGNKTHMLPTSPHQMNKKAWGWGQKTNEQLFHLKCLHGMELKI